MQAIRTTLAAALLALGACADQPSPVADASAGAAPLLSAAPGRGIDGHYVVVLREGADPRSVAAVAGIHPQFVYTSAISGFSARLNAGQLTALRHHPGVAYVEQDQVVEATQTSTVPWGLDRIDQRNLPLDGRTPVHATASGVYAYVIDTGIQVANAQFGGRATNVYDAFGGSGADCNGHGTGVAAVIGGATYGVAKGVRLRGVRVLDCAGTGTTAGIIAGIDWVRLNRANPAVANISLGGALSSALNTAAANLANSGVFVAVAAGNSNANACSYSPGSAPAVATVAASTITDARASFSNYGSCVDLYAPGSGIPTVSLTGTITRSGTSMASPHVAGVAALYKAAFGNAATATIDAWIKTNATPGVITGNPAGTPNRLLYTAGL